MISAIEVVQTLSPTTNPTNPTQEPSLAPTEPTLMPTPLPTRDANGIRINCGATENTTVDGVIWQADQFCM